MKKEKFNNPKRTSKYDLNRDSYLESKDTYVYLGNELVERHYEKKIVARISRDDVENFDEIVQMLDKLDHREDLQNRYQMEHEDFAFRNKQNSYAKGFTTSNPWDDIADPKADIDEILFPSDVTNEEIKFLLSKTGEWLDTLSPMQFTLFYDLFGARKSLKQICDEENEANGTHKTPQSVANRKNRLLNNAKKFFLNALKEKNNK